MRSHLTVRKYKNTLSNAFKSMGSLLCTTIITPETFFLFINTMRLHFCISGGDKQVFNSDMIIVKRFFSSLFYHC